MQYIFSIVFNLLNDRTINIFNHFFDNDSELAENKRDLNRASNCETQFGDRIFKLVEF